MGSSQHYLLVSPAQFPALSPSTMLSLMLIFLTFACCVFASPVGPHGQEGALLNAGLSLAAQLGGGAHTCDMVEVPDSVCAVLYDEEKCKAQSDHLVLGGGGQGVLPLLYRGLRRNDVESLVVRARCKLELWGSHHGLERGEQADLVLDRQQEFRNLFID